MPVPVFPGMPETSADRGDVMGRVGRQRTGIPAWVRVAAAVAVVALGAWAVVVKPWNIVFGPPPSLSAADGVYNRLVRTGFTPDWVCGSEQEFLASRRRNSARRSP